MSNAAIKDLLDWQSEIRRQVQAGSYEIRVEDLRKPKGHVTDVPPEPLEKRVIEL